MAGVWNPTFAALTTGDWRSWGTGHIASIAGKKLSQFTACFTWTCSKWQVAILKDIRVNQAINRMVFPAITSFIIWFLHFLVSFLKGSIFT